MVIFNFKYHLIFSVLFFLVIEKYTTINLGVLGLIGCLLVFALPDIDLKHSKIGRELRPVSAVVSGVTTHRGVTHSLFAILIVSIIASFTNNSQFINGVVIGYSSHLIADLSTPQGIMLFWPFPIWIRIPIISKFKFFSGLIWIVLFIGLLIYNPQINNLFEQHLPFVKEVIQIKKFKF